MEQDCINCKHHSKQDFEAPCRACSYCIPADSPAYSEASLMWEPVTDNVNHPSHYETGKFECIDVMVETQGEESVKEYCLCAAFKYLYRHKRKNGVEDIKKAIWYLNKYVELEGNKE